MAAHLSLRGTAMIELSNAAAVFAGAIKIRMDAVKAWQQRRQTLRMLCALGPDQLADIGLTTFDLDGVSKAGRHRV